MKSFLVTYLWLPFTQNFCVGLSDQHGDSIHLLKKILILRKHNNQLQQRNSELSSIVLLSFSVF